MLTNGPNIYQAARKESCLTQEQAAERLEVSETTVKAWEQGQRVPDNETVARMAELYETPWLALEHLKQAGGVLGVLPEVNVQSLPTAAITLINRVLDFAERHRDRQLLRIAEDGIIDEKERPDFDAICRDLDGIVGAALQVKYTSDAPPKTKKERPEAATSERSVQGLASKNDSKIIIPHPIRIASPTLSREGGVSR